MTFGQNETAVAAEFAEERSTRPAINRNFGTPELIRNDG